MKSVIYRFFVIFMSLLGLLATARADQPENNLSRTSNAKEYLMERSISCSLLVSLIERIDLIGQKLSAADETDTPLELAQDERALLEAIAPGILTKNETSDESFEEALNKIVDYRNEQFNQLWREMMDFDRDLTSRELNLAPDLHEFLPKMIYDQMDRYLTITKWLKSDAVILEALVESSKNAHHINLGINLGIGISTLFAVGGNLKITKFIGIFGLGVFASLKTLFLNDPELKLYNKIYDESTSERSEVLSKLEDIKGRMKNLRSLDKKYLKEPVMLPVGGILI